MKFRGAQCRVVDQPGRGGFHAHHRFPLECSDRKERERERERVIFPTCHPTRPRAEAVLPPAVTARRPTALPLRYISHNPPYTYASDKFWTIRALDNKQHGWTDLKKILNSKPEIKPCPDEAWTIRRRKIWFTFPQ